VVVGLEELQHLRRRLSRRFGISAPIVVSYATPARREHQLTGLTYATVTSEQDRGSRLSRSHRDVINSAVVPLLIVAADIYFNG
jgi:hypothetical protein